MAKGRNINRNKNRNADYFSRKMYLRQLPLSLISYLGLAVADITDAVVIGQKMGVVGLAAVSMALPVYMIMNVVIHSFGAGGSIVYARLLGEGREKEAAENFNGIIRTAIGIGILCAVAGNLFLRPMLLLLGAGEQGSGIYQACSDYVRIIVSAFPTFVFSYVMNYYLRNAGREKTAGIGLTLANVTDVSLNILLVLVWDRGTAGAALATVIGQLAAGIFYLTVLSGQNSLRLSFKRVRYCEKIKCFRLGFSSAVQYVFSFLFVLSANRILMKISGDTGVAVFDMIQNVSIFILYFYEAASKAAQPIISTFHGEHNYDGQKRIFFWNVLSGMLAGGACIAAAALWPEKVCILFGLTKEGAVALGIPALRIFLAGAFFAGINLLLEGYAQACEREREAFGMAALRGAVFLLPSMFFFAGFGITGFWWLFFVTELLSFAVFLYISCRKGAKGKTDTERVYSTTIAGTIPDMAELADEIERFCERWNAAAKQIYFMRMTLEELCVAIMNHQEDRNGYIQITLIACEDTLFELHVRDNAVSFNPFEMQTGKADETDCDMDAMGMLVIKNRAKEMFYRRYQGFNCLIVKI